jgi:hypothetical protein
MILNRTLAYLIILSVATLAGCFLVYNFYQTETENYGFDWQTQSFRSQQFLEAAESQ